MTTPDFVIRTEGLTRYFGKKKAVDSVTFQVPRGSVFAFMGRNGSGKTTTIRMLLGLLRPTRGTAMVLGQYSENLSPETRGRIGYISESHSLHEWMTVLQEGYFASRFHPRWNTRIFRKIIDHFGLPLDARVRNLSRGERAGLALAITLAPQPELLILDDPAIGLDPVARRALLETMLYVTRDSNRTIMFSSHAVEDVERVADHVAVVDGSVLRAAAPVDEITGSMRQYQLTFAPGRAPGQLPEILGLLSVRRHRDSISLIVVRPGDDTPAVIASLGAAAVNEMPVPFSDAIAGYLGDRGSHQSFLDEPVLANAGGA